MMMASPIGQVTLTPMNKLCVEVTEYQDFVFLLGQLWKVNMDQLKAHWVCNLYAIGSSDQGKKVSISTHYLHLIISIMLLYCATDLLGDHGQVRSTE